MAHGKSAELAAIKPGPPEGLCVKCRTPWSTHLRKDGKRLKRYDNDDHINTAGVEHMGFTLPGAPMGPQAGPFPENRGRSSDARPRRSKPTVSWVKRERAERQARALLEAEQARAAAEGRRRSGRG